MPVAIGAEGDLAAGKRAKVTKQIKKLKKRIAALESKPDQVGQIPASLPPDGPAGGALAGTFPNPQIAADAVAANQIVDGALGTAEFASSIPAVHVTNSGNQSIGDQGVTVLAFDTERYDTASMHGPANDALLTAPVTGIYAITAQVQWPGTSAAGVRQLSLQRSATTSFLAVDTRDDIASTVLPTSQEVTTQAKLQAGESVRALVYQESGGALNVVANPEFSPEFSMTWLAPG